MNPSAESDVALSHSISFAVAPTYIARIVAKEGPSCISTASDCGATASRNRARTLIYTTGLPPAVLASAIAALDLIEREPRRLLLPLAKAQNFTRATNLPLAQSSIVPVIVGEARAALQASELLEREGFLAVAIRPPTVPEGTARLRLSFSAVHPDAEIARLADVVRTRILRAA